MAKKAAQPKPEQQIAHRATDVGALALVVENVPAQVLTALKTSLYPGASDNSIALVIAYCQAGQLDPLTKPVHIVPMSIKTGQKDGAGKDIYEMRDVIMPGIELYRVKAHRSKEYAGIDDAVFGDEVEMDLATGDRDPIKYLTFHFPEWCTVRVYRKRPGDDEARGFSATVRWLETYATQSRYSKFPNAMWEKRPFGQLEKCAEAMALRKAFPEFVGAQPTAEEMMGKTLDPEHVVATVETIREPRTRQISDDSRSGSNTTGSHTGASRSATGSEGSGRSAGTEKTTAASGRAGSAGNGKPGEPGIHLEDGPRKILNRWMTAARVTEAKLLERFPHVGLDNFNPIVAELRTLAAAEGNDEEKPNVAGDAQPGASEEE